MFSELDNQEAQIGIELQRTTSLRQSVLGKAFSGKLVRQDPSEEPASALLERTKAQKEVRASERVPKRKAKTASKKSKRRKDAA
jgi:type I restriction enzyme S subunit